MERKYRATAEDLKIIERFVKDVCVRHAEEPLVKERWYGAKELADEVNGKVIQFQKVAGFELAPRTRPVSVRIGVVDVGLASITADEFDEDLAVPMLTELSVEEVSRIVFADIYAKSVRTANEEIAAEALPKVVITMDDLRPLPKANRASINTRLRKAGILLRARPWQPRGASARGPCKWADVPLYRCD